MYRGCRSVEGRVDVSVRAVGEEREGREYIVYRLIIVCIYMVNVRYFMLIPYKVSIPVEITEFDQN